MSKATSTLPYAPDRKAWSWVERSELGGGHHGCDLLFRAPCPAGEEGPELPLRLVRALPLLLHQFDQLDLTNLPGSEPLEKEAVPAPSPAAVLRRILPQLLTYRYVEAEKVREWVLQGGRPSSLHVLGRVLATGFKFRLEDLSHLATHGELLVEALERVGLDSVIDADAILYCPALDANYPFKFAVMGASASKNREAFLRLLQLVLRAAETDETFRTRHFKELQRGFQKFGPAVATPAFQEVELRVWRILGYMAARLRVKAGRLSDTRDPKQVRKFLAELRDAHAALDDLVHLPSRVAALFRSRFDIEFSKVHELTFPELDAIARRIDCDPTDRDRSIDAVASLVSTMRKLGSTSPLEALEEKDREIKLAYGDTRVPPLETGWARTYTDTIFTGAERVDTRRFGAASSSPLAGVGMKEEDLELDLDFLNKPAEAEPAAEDEEAPAEAPVEDEAGLSDSSADWRLQPGAEWQVNEADLDAVFGPDGAAGEEVPDGEND